MAEGKNGELCACGHQRLAHGRTGTCLARGRGEGWMYDPCGCIEFQPRTPDSTEGKAERIDLSALAREIAADAARDLDINGLLAGDRDVAEDYLCDVVSQHLSAALVRVQQGMESVLVDQNARLGRQLDEQAAEVARLRGELDQARLSLEQFGRHPNSCKKWWHHQIEGSVLQADKPCTCGLNNAIRRISEGAGESKP